MNLSSLTDFDLHLIAEGTHYRTYEKLGAHPVEVDGVAGTVFRVWAPNAQRVTVIGDFNGWNREAAPMQLRPEAGVWECFVPGVGVCVLYKYFLESRFNGYRVEKADPYGFAAEIRPQTASKVWDVTKYRWGDGGWMSARPQVLHHLSSQLPKRRLGQQIPLLQEYSHNTAVRHTNTSKSSPFHPNAAW